jgi:hypothetical protein
MLWKSDKYKTGLFHLCIECVFRAVGMMIKRKRVQVVFTPEQWNLIENFRGELGEGDAEIIRNMVLAWLSEKSIISTNAKNKINNRYKE